MATEMSLAARLKQAQEAADDPLVRSIASEAARLPSDTFLWTALGALGLSLALFQSGKKADAMFVGQLATPILALGIYKKFLMEGTEPATN